jgi:hypothetical protein
MPTAPETWDRQPGESEEAYRAFCVFRDMGPDRELIGAYRSTKGTAEGPSRARNTPGRWKTWLADHDWRRRALAWDNHRSAVAARAIDEADDANARKWANRLQEVADDEWDVAAALMRKVKVWAAMPPISRTKLPDGTLVEPVGIQDTERVAKIAQMASQMAYAAIGQALPDLNIDLDPTTATTEQLTAAIERLEAAIAPVRPRIARTG